MHLACKAAVAVMLALSIAPAAALTDKDKSDCEQMTAPSLKVAACTRILSAANLPADLQAFGHHHRGVGLLLQGKYDDAIVEFNAALKADPSYAKSYNSRGNAWRAKGEVDFAIADFNAAIGLDPNFAFPYNGRASAYADKGDYDKAIADYGEVIRLAPTLAAPYNNRAVALRTKGDFDRALDDANEALRRDPKNPAIYSTRGEIWRMKGDLDRALADQNEAVRLDPQSPLPFLTRGDLYRYRGEFDRALADYDQALKVSQGYIPALVGRGLTFEKQGDIARARAEYEKALNSPSEFKGDIAGQSLETARTRLAAFASGAPQPVIPPAPARATSPDSIPTPAVAAPAPVAAAVPQGRRVALVIGNAAYINANKLMNPEHDAEVVGASLRAVGFDSVTVLEDGTHDKMIAALRAFAAEAATADWALVYYSGHGMEAYGINFLIPVDARLSDARDLMNETVVLDQVIAAVDGAKKLKLVLLDACRTNPFLAALHRTASLDVGLTQASSAASPQSSQSPQNPYVVRSVDRGLGEIKVPGGTLVVYAAKHGQTALDGQGNDSPFAVALVQRIATPNVEVDKLFRLVRDDVLEATAGRQEPYTYGSLPGHEDFFFVQK
ncbi:MAG: tetratricopeptide repeat protein [Xanthobacteraceae bacterium]